MSDLMETNPSASSQRSFRIPPRLPNWVEDKTNGMQLDERKSFLAEELAKADALIEEFRNWWERTPENPSEAIDQLDLVLWALDCEDPLASDEEIIAGLQMVAAAMQVELPDHRVQAMLVQELRPYPYRLIKEGLRELTFTMQYPRFPLPLEIMNAVKGQQSSDDQLMVKRMRAHGLMRKLIKTMGKEVRPKSAGIMNALEHLK